MALSNAYLNQVKNLPQILKSLREAQAPERFTHKFLEGLDFKSTNDRGIIGVLKAMEFIDESGAPKQPYFDYLDEEIHRVVLADGIRRAYADLFKLNNKANDKDGAWVKGKLKMLTQGKKGDAVLSKMTVTFLALCKEADFTTSPQTREAGDNEDPIKSPPQEPKAPEPLHPKPAQRGFALAYNIHIELPAVRDQLVYDAIFKSLRDNLL